MIPVGRVPTKLNLLRKPPSPPPVPVQFPRHPLPGNKARHTTGDHR